MVGFGRSVDYDNVGWSYLLHHKTALLVHVDPWWSHLKTLVLREVDFIVPIESAERDELNYVIFIARYHIKMRP